MLKPRVPFWTLTSLDIEGKPDSGGGLCECTNLPRFGRTLTPHIHGRRSLVFAEAVRVGLYAVECEGLVYRHG